MRKAIKTLMLVGICLAMYVFMRPNPAYQRVPKYVLSSHYRIVSRVGGEGISCGTGIAIGRRTILTAEHVIAKGETFEMDIFDEDGKELRTIQLHLVASRPNFDLALLESDEDIPYWNDLSLGDFSVGSWGYIIGAAQSTVPYNCYFGVFASKYGPNKLICLGQIAVSVPPGESGGGVYDAETNRLVGVLVRSREGFSLFVPMKMITEFLQMDQLRTFHL